jgi:hypothetical protein
LFIVGGLWSDFEKIQVQTGGMAWITHTARDAGLWFGKGMSAERLKFWKHEIYLLLYKN